MIRDLIAPYLIQIIGGLALAAALAAGVQTVRLWRLQADTADDAAQLTVCQGANASWASIAAAQARERDAAEAQRQRAERAAQAALREAAEAKADAAKDFRDWQRRWEGRPQTCAIALTQMEAACAGSLSDY